MERNYFKRNKPASPDLPIKNDTKILQIYQYGKNGILERKIDSLSQTLIFQISVSLQPNVVELRYFKLLILLDQY